MGSWVVAWRRSNKNLIRHRPSAATDERLLPQIEDEVNELDTAGMDSLTTKQSRKRFHAFHIPEHVLVVNYFGTPLIGSISSMARESFLQLRNYGPNDGLTLLSDMIFPGGVTLAELGRDHFLLAERIDVTAVALAITVIRRLGNYGPKMFQTPGS